MPRAATSFRLLHRAAAMRSTLAAAVMAAATFAAPALASPCSAPAEFVRSQAGERQPLTRPYVVQGMAVTAVQQRDGAAWLELAVDSEATARRTLGAQAGELVSAGGAVLLSCRALGGIDARSVAQRHAPVAERLW